MLQPEPDVRQCPINQLCGVSLPLVLSIICHTCLAIGLAYASVITTHYSQVEASDPGISVTMFNLADFSESTNTEPVAIQPESSAMSEQSRSQNESAIDVAALSKPEVPEQMTAIEREQAMPEVEKAKIIATPPKKAAVKTKKVVSTRTENVNRETNKRSHSLPHSDRTESQQAISSMAKSHTGGSSEVTGGTPLNKVTPIYPERARSMGIEGEVKVHFDINAQGKIENIKLINEYPKNMFFGEVRKALLRWQYAPNHPIKNKEMRFTFSLTTNVQMQ